MAPSSRNSTEDSWMLLLCEDGPSSALPSPDRRKRRQQNWIVEIGSTRSEGVTLHLSKEEKIGSRIIFQKAKVKQKTVFFLLFSKLLPQQNFMLSAKMGVICPCSQTPAPRRFSEQEFGNEERYTKSAYRPIEIETAGYWVVKSGSAQRVRESSFKGGVCALDVKR